MAVIRGRSAASMLPEAVVLDLGDLARQGDRLIERARAESARIVREAVAERERLIADASAIGHERGYAEGLRIGTEKGMMEGRERAIREATQSAARVIEGWSAGLSQLEASVSELVASVRGDLVRFAVEFAERVTRRAIAVDDTTIAPVMERALSMVMGVGEITVRISPVDRGVAERVIGPILERIGSSATVRLVEDPALAPGSCVVRTISGVVDAAIDGMIERMVDALVPGRGARCGDAGDGGADGEGGSAVTPKVVLGSESARDASSDILMDGEGSA